MNLTFRVLWYDDRRDFFDSLDLAPFTEHVREWGFEPLIDLVTTVDDFMKRQPFATYDLIVVDYNLEKDELHGEDFIKRVRDNRVYTEIIFYSANPSSDLWSAIHKKQIEGVFVSDRDLIVTKLESVAHQSVHKVLDLNNMRGMVMAEVSDIDLTIDSILAIGIAGLKSEESSEIFDRFHAALLEQAKQNSAKLEDFKKNPTAEQMASLCDSFKRWATFNRLRAFHPVVDGFKGGNYADDVLGPRNHLAHGQPKEVDGGYIFRFGKKEYLFDEKASLSLRKVILDYKRKFQEIHEQLNTKRP